MPRKKGTGKGSTERFNIRLDEHTGAYYRTKANEHGVSVSDYLRQMLVQGVIAENVREIELRLQRVVAQINVSGGGDGKATIPDEVLLSVFTSEALLTAIVESKDPQELYNAQDAARAKLKRIKG
ncbi:plasmid mobilization protein (plasmid) [Ralstonia pseudosolanacearum]